MSRVSLTLLQSAVIRRLRDAGYSAIAECAKDAWSRGERCGLPVHITDPDLLTEYGRANGQAKAEH